MCQISKHHSDVLHMFQEPRALPLNNKAMESFSLSECCPYLYLTKHGTRTSVVKIQSLEETNHVAGAGHGGVIITALRNTGVSVVSLPIIAVSLCVCVCECVVVGG